MSKRGQRSGARWSLAILAGCLVISSVQAQQTTDSGEQGGFVVIEDAQQAPPPKPLALPSSPAPVTPVAAASAPATPPPQFKPLPTLPPNALPLIERTPPVAAAPHPQPATATGSHVVPVVTTPGHPATAFALSKTSPSVSVPAVAKPYVIPSGEMISEGLAKYVKSFGWSLRWLVPPDYHLDAPFPIPAGLSMKEGVKYVVSTYQSQGGLIGDKPRFADPNSVVVIEPVQPAKGEQ